MMDLNVKVLSDQIIEALRERIGELEDLEATGAGTPDTCEMLVDLQQLLDRLDTLLLERLRRRSH